MDYYILLVFIAGFLAGIRFGDRLRIPHAERVASILAILLLFVTGFSLGSSWFSAAVSAVVPLSLLMAVLAIFFSLVTAELLWRNMK
ncbi:MAG: hypothetical protein QXX17_03880 [Conexivisphaerales archaeon]